MLGGVPDGVLHEERGYLGVCACVLRVELAVEEPALACRAAGVRDRRCADGLG